MRYQWGMGGYHSNYTISFLLAWLSLPLRTATSSNWVERYSIIQRPKNLAWTYLHCRRLVISDALVSSMDAQLLCFPTRICGSVSAPLEVAHVAGRLSSDCLRSLCCIKPYRNHWPVEWKKSDDGRCLLPEGLPPTGHSSWCVQVDCGRGWCVRVRQMSFPI